jgi:RNA polymerase sigma-70 factor (ECF subfamily)
MIVTDTAVSLGSRQEDNANLEHMQSVVYRYCLSLTGSKWDAEDLAQDTWLKAIDTLQSSGHTNPEAFLLRIARNTWIDRARRNSTLVRILERIQPKLTLPDNGNLEIEMAFHSLMKHLSPLQRTVFLLRDVCGFSIEEAAEALNTTAGAIKAALHRARHSLEAVKAELEKGELLFPEEEGLRALLQVIAAAYQAGDIAALIELSLQGEIAPAAAIGLVQHKLLLKSRFLQNDGAEHAIQMAA